MKVAGSRNEVFGLRNKCLDGKDLIDTISTFQEHFYTSNRLKGNHLKISLGDKQLLAKEPGQLNISSRQIFT